MILTEDEQKLICWKEYVSENQLPYLKIMILTKEEQELIADLEKINKMTYIEMVCLVRYYNKHKYFDLTKPFFNYFNKRYQSMGGMALDISHETRWPLFNTYKEHIEWVKKLES